MSVAHETPIASVPRPPSLAPHNGRWAGYRHLLAARLLELKREPEVVFWVFVFPLLLALGMDGFFSEANDVLIPKFEAVISRIGIYMASPAKISPSVAPLLVTIPIILGRIIFLFEICFLASLARCTSKYLSF